MQVLPPAHSSAPHPARSLRVACLVSSADRCSVSSVRACVPCLAWSALVFARPGSGTACAAPCRAQPFRVRWSGQGAPPAGYIAAAQPRPVSPVTTEKIKKTHPTFTKRNPSDCASRQKFRKIQKGPFRNLDCAIIS